MPILIFNGWTMHGLMVIAATLVLVSCQLIASPSQAAGQIQSIHYSGGGGLTQETAVVISGAKSSVDGVPAEYAWLEQHLVGGERYSQSLIERFDKLYDAVRVRFQTGETRTVRICVFRFLMRDTP